MPSWGLAEFTTPHQSKYLVSELLWLCCFEALLGCLGRCIVSCRYSLICATRRLANFEEVSWHLAVTWSAAALLDRMSHRFESRGLFRSRGACLWRCFLCLRSSLPAYSSGRHGNYAPSPETDCLGGIARTSTGRRRCHASHWYPYDRDSFLNFQFRLLIL